MGDSMTSSYQMYFFYKYFFLLGILLVILVGYGLYLTETLDVYNFILLFLVIVFLICCHLLWPGKLKWVKMDDEGIHIQKYCEVV